MRPGSQAQLCHWLSVTVGRPLPFWAQFPSLYNEGSPRHILSLVFWGSQTHRAGGLQGTALPLSSEKESVFP